MKLLKILKKSIGKILMQMYFVHKKDFDKIKIYFFLFRKFWILYFLLIETPHMKRYKYYQVKSNRQLINL